MINFAIANVRANVICDYQRYNPELQRRSLENRKEKQENFNEWVAQLKKHSKSDLPRKFLLALVANFFCILS